MNSPKEMCCDSTAAGISLIFLDLPSAHAFHMM